MKLDFELDHIGIAVDSLAKGKSFYEALGLGPMETETVAKEKVNVGMFELGNRARLELLEAYDPDSPIGKFLSKRGPGIHHICLRVPDVRKTLKALQEQGVQVIDKEPWAGAHGCLVGFVHPKATGGVLIELSQPPAAPLPSSRGPA